MYQNISFLIQEYTGQRKPIFWYILRSGAFAYENPGKNVLEIVKTENF